MSSKVNKQFSLKLYGILDGSFRLVIDEIEGLRKRFQAADALNGDPKLTRYLIRTPYIKVLL